jgi:hypothetical protein
MMAKSIDHEARLAAALRENLRRRKAGRTDGTTEPAPERDSGEPKISATDAPRPNPAAKNT